MKDLAICTCLSGNYGAQGRVFVESLRRFHPEVPVYAVVPDWEPGEELFPGLGVRRLGLEELRIVGLWRLRVRYGRKALLVAAKPSVLRYLLEEGYRSVLFLDPDLYVLGALEDVLDVVRAHALTLTPHWLPGWRGALDWPAERALLLAGQFNGGLVGVSGEEGRRFVEWWERRVHGECFDAVESGLHYDQRWLDLAPGLVGDLNLLRDAGVNVGHWRIAGARVEAGPRINGVPVRLLHFSGYEVGKPLEVSRYAPGLSVRGGALEEVYLEYARKMHEAGYERYVTRRWAWEGLSRRWQVRLRLAPR